MADNRAKFEHFAPLLDRPKRGCDGRLWSFCPCHPDGAKHANAPEKGLAGRSLSLHPAMGLTAFCGCKYEEIVAALEHVSAKLPAPSRNGKSPGEHTVAIYDYEKPDGTLVARKHRIEGPDGKRFLWYLPGADKAGGVPPMRDMPLYGVTGLTLENLSQPCYFAEGEKAMEALNAHNMLAVCAGGGSGQQDFGDGLKVLAGRHVRLWADNDAVGRAYMELLAIQLRGIAATVSFVTPPIPLPVKGDAYDYFELGGTVEALEAQQGPTQPVAEVTGEDAVRITIPTAGGPVQFDFAEVTPGAHRLEAQVTVNYGKDEPYRVRRNLLSGSERTDFRRSLENMYGKDVAWERILNIAYNKGQEIWKQLDISADPATVPVDMSAEMFDVPLLLPSSGLTIWFGDGASGKTFLAEDLMLAYVTGGTFCNLSTPNQPVLFLDYEDSLVAFRRRLERLRLGRGWSTIPMNRIYYLPGRGLPMPEQVDRIKRLVAQRGIRRMIVDSINIACGGKPEEAEIATAFCRSLERIGLPTLALGHITKAGETHKPFGSVVWANSARRTWWVNRVEEEDSAFLDVAFVCRKANDGRLPKPIPVRMQFEDPAGPIVVKRGDFNTATALADTSLSLRDRCKQALDRQPLTIEDMLDAMGLPNEKSNYDKLYMTLSRGLKMTPQQFVHVGSKWGLATSVY